jgi:hypothetical protein
MTLPAAGKLDDHAGERPDYWVLCKQNLHTAAPLACLYLCARSPLAIQLITLKNELVLLL